jgi:stage IV sporulation protein FB
MHRDGGSLLILRDHGAVPIRLHWSLLIAMAFWGRFSLGGAIGFTVILLAHELGHAALVRRRGLRTIGIELHWAGGECRYDAAGASPMDTAIVAWGGVLAQGVLLALAWSLARTLEPGGLLGDFLHALIVPNLWLILLNLLPFGPLDGARAWPLLPMLFARRRRRHLERTHDKLRRELDAIRRRRELEAAADDD